MYPKFVSFQLCVICVGMFTVYTFPVENEVINKVYHELRDIVKMQRNIANKRLDLVVPLKNETKLNNTKSVPDYNQSYNQPTSTINNDMPINITNDKGTYTKPSSTSNDLTIDQFSKLKNNSDASFKNDTSQLDNTTSGNSTSIVIYGKDLRTNISSSNQSENILTSLQTLQDNSTNLDKNKTKVTNNATLKLPAQIIKRQVSNTDETEEKIRDKIQGIPPSRIKRKVIETGGLTDEIQDILPDIREEEEGRMSVRTKRKIEEGNIMNGELTNEIVDIREERRGNVQHKQHEGARSFVEHGVDSLSLGTRSIFWKTHPSFQPNPEEAPNFSNNHMHHDPHFEQHNSNSIPNDHSIHPEESEHAHQQVSRLSPT